MPALTDYQGLLLRLTEERLRHIQEHPEMAGLADALAETLRQPEQIVESLSDPEAHLHYHLYNYPTLGSKYLCVVVKMTADPFVLTAYLTDRIKQGRVLWTERS